eukprot:TRINITY_DN2941_c2_g1_i1.p3 TRINITY_DN2941_c2_g1~~TRINITY_DN2941_c2_g1_i1.p3  ORF type:complete len:112 (+),score=0.71 TRINITY_DN2941_c2_g1_i1:1063-1398(+)
MEIWFLATASPYSATDSFPAEFEVTIICGVDSLSYRQQEFSIFRWQHSPTFSGLSSSSTTSASSSPCNPVNRAVAQLPNVHAQQPVVMFLNNSQHTLVFAWPSCFCSQSPP